MRALSHDLTLKWWPIAAVLVLIAPAARAELSDADREQVREVGERFVEAWLLDAPQSVMATLDDDATLIPHHGAAPVVGETAIRAFWWPPGGPPVAVVEFQQSYEEISGDGNLAYARGRFELAFEMDVEGQTRMFRNEGNYLMLLRRGDDGVWRITHRIWNDPVPDVE